MANVPTAIMTMATAVHKAANLPHHRWHSGRFQAVETGFPPGQAAEAPHYAAAKPGYTHSAPPSSGHRRPPRADSLESRHGTPGPEHAPPVTPRHVSATAGAGCPRPPGRRPP